MVGHGQMSGHELEDVMLKFFHREADVLVSTNIIESGLDVATANTMIINRPERFGLADLHQLRGRVGRSKHRAYCYLLLSPKFTLQETARGGASRRSSTTAISAPVFRSRCATWSCAARATSSVPSSRGTSRPSATRCTANCSKTRWRRLRNEPQRQWRPVNLELGITTTIPRSYIRSERQRMDVYKRLTSCATPVDIESLESGSARRVRAVAGRSANAVAPGGDSGAGGGVGSARDR